MIAALFTMSAILSAASPAADSARLTQLRVVLDSTTWANIKESKFLPISYGSGYLAGPAEIRLCGRLSCIVMIPEDSASGELVGNLVIGVRPIAGSSLAEQLTKSSTLHTQVAIVAPPEYELPGTGEAPLIYYLENATIAVDESDIPALGDLLRSAGADVYQEGEGIVVQFANQMVRLIPAWSGTGPEQMTFFLRREQPGNPTYKFGTRARLRFGPGRTATWTF